MDVGAITRFCHCMRWMWVQLFAVDVGAITFFIVCDGCGCNYYDLYIVCDGCGCNY